MKTAAEPTKKDEGNEGAKKDKEGNKETKGKGTTGKGGENP
jgi:hypothetical protein